MENEPMGEAGFAGAKVFTGVAGLGMENEPMGEAGLGMENEPIGEAGFAGANVFMAGTGLGMENEPMGEAGLFIIPGSEGMAPAGLKAGEDDAGGCQDTGLVTGLGTGSCTGEIGFCIPGKRPGRPGTGT